MLAGFGRGGHPAAATASGQNNSQNQSVAKQNRPWPFCLGFRAEQVATMIKLSGQTLQRVAKIRKLLAEI